jgi:hypothetical protein
MTIDWAQPLSSAPLTTSPAAVFLRALAAELDAGAPPFYSLTFRTDNQVDAQLAAGRDQEPAALSAWARIFGVSTVKREEGHGGSSNNRYSVASLFAGYRLEVWDAWPDRDSKGPTTHVPLAEFDRGFDDPPAAPFRPDEHDWRTYEGRGYRPESAEEYAPHAPATGYAEENSEASQA